MSDRTARRAQQVELWLVGFKWKRVHAQRTRISCYIEDRIIGAVGKDGDKWYWLLRDRGGPPFDSEAEAQADFEQQWLNR